MTETEARIARKLKQLREWYDIVRPGMRAAVRKFTEEENNRYDKVFSVDVKEPDYFAINKTFSNG